MAQNEIIVKFKVDSDGGLKMVTREANDAADATEKLTKKRDNYKRGEKGVSQQSANGTKNFSKMRDAIGGSGGLVSAYAALAANVFALTAAFNFLKRAADLSILQASQESFAASSGVALQSITSRLQDASGGMLQFRDAAQAAAIATAKGFSPKQMEDLAAGAQKAAAALGRDFQDAFDRLVRGASKAEPELLDELGITLRLADATEKYGRIIGKNAKELTASERSQAVLLETQRQLNEMYGNQEAVANPYQQLAKTFDDLINKITQGVLPVFNAIADVINRSVVATLAVFGMLGVSIIKQMDFLGPLQDKWGSYTAGVKASVEESKASIQAMKDEIAATTEAQARAAQAGGKKSARSALKEGVGIKSALIQKMAKGDLTDPKQIGQLRKALKRAEAEYKQHGEVRNGILEGANEEMLQDLIKTTDEMAKAPRKTERSLKGFFKTVPMRAKLAFKQVKNKGVQAFSAVGRVAVSTGKLVGKAMKFAGVIGILTTVFNIGMKVAESPYTIVSSFLGGLSTALNAVGKLIGPSILVPIGKAIDFIVNAFKKKYNRIASIVNAGADLFGLEAPLDMLNDKSSAAADAMGILAEGNVDLESTLRKNIPAFDGLMISAQKHENAAELDRIQTEKATEAFERQEAMAEDLKNTLQGLQDPITNMSKAQKGGVQATYLATAGISDQVKSIYSSIRVRQEMVDAEGKVSAKAVTIQRHDTETRKKLLNDLIAKMEGLGMINEEAMAALQQGEAGIETLVKLETAAQRANAAFNSMKEAAGAVQGSISEGNLSGAEFGISRLRDEAIAAAEAFRSLGTEEAAAKAAEALETYNNITESTGQSTEEYYQSLVRLRTAQEANKIVAEGLFRIGGELGALRKQENELAGVTLQLLEIEIQLKGQLNEQTRVQLELQQKLLAEKARAAEIGIIEKEQGKEMGAVARAGDILDKGVFGQESAAKKEMAQQDSLIGSLEAERSYTFDPEELAKIDAQIEEAKKKIAESEEFIASIKTSDKIGALRDAANPMIENLKQLGPEGELMASMTSGAMTLAEVFTDAFEKINEGSFTMQDGMAMAASAVQALGAMQAAQSKAAVTAIDKQIAAEKKRDGKSKESIAKIQQLEKKKEKIERKAFEQKKKANMASVVISTATAIMKEAEKGLAGLPGIALFTAMGAMQLSAIASQKYEGGSASLPSGPSKISVGNRQNTVDLARAKSPSGELAYARGASGTGQGMTNYTPTPAFTGMKYRANGGNTALMVGEQGPEMFVPDRPGTIVPADETELATQAPLNINFSINAVDGQSVEEMLLGQRGNIIGMIREAANGSGETFLESVNVLSDQYQTV